MQPSAITLTPIEACREQRQWNYDAAGNWLSTGDGTTLSMRTQDLYLNKLTRIGGAGRMMLEGHVSEFATVTVNVYQGPQGRQAVLMSDPAGGYNFHVEVDLKQGTNFITLIAQDLDGQQTTRQYSYSAAGLSRGFSNSSTHLSSDYDASYATVRQFEYDAKNRLKTVTVSGTTWEWDYDYQDRRVREWQYAAGGTKPAWPAKLFIWDGTELVQERNVTSATNYTAGGTVSRTHYYGGFVDGTKNYQTTTDHLGNVREVIAANAAAGTLGSVVARYDYSAYQKPVKVSGTTVNASLLINSRYYHHEASGLELALYRAYDPELGRWLSEDPIGEAGGLNLYGYVGNNPLMLVDPLGLANLNVNGEIWHTPIEGDLGHPHKSPFDGEDMGDHFHGPEGKKYFPKCNTVMDKHGNVSSAGNKFKKQFEKAVRNQISSPKLRGKIMGGAASMLFAAAWLNPDDVAAQDLRSALDQYNVLKSKGLNTQEASSRAASCGAQLFGNVPGLWILDQLENGGP